VRSKSDTGLRHRNQAANGRKAVRAKRAASWPRTICISRLIDAKITRRTIGHYILDGERKRRKFWLGRDSAVAMRRIEALDVAWEGLPGQREDRQRRLR